MHITQRNHPTPRSLGIFLFALFLGGCASQKATLHDDHLFGDSTAHQALLHPPPPPPPTATPSPPKEITLPKLPLSVPGVVSPLPSAPSAPITRLWPAPARFPLWQLASQPRIALLRQRLVHLASQPLPSKKILRYRGQSFRYDCSGYVSFAYAHLGFSLLTNTDALDSAEPANGVKRIYHYSRHIGAFHDRKIPSIGDLVFWHGTYDVNHDGRLDDPWTHIAIVESVDQRGTITFLHAEKNRIRRGRMNLLLPHHQRDTNYNTSLRRCRFPSDRCHTSELWAGFATLLKNPLPPHLDGSFLASRRSQREPATPRLPFYSRPPRHTRSRRWLVQRDL
ncbi:C40 family peptidase [Myxococcota bacterium]|nr:C40 family peptidase [Myxococcota bacterium]